ncbi:MAG: hypothetical protein HKO62_00945 [Gammaproteobacteria bacterium]|nr:hypothetical protein [Gammaproteobacteria bacterium]NNL99283.1 hypothetical protein [Gammaproteobacteria bacterium]
MYYKEFLGAVAIAITCFAYVPYIRAILGGTIKPHVFSWIIWGSATFVVGAAQLDDGGGPGGFAILVSGFISLIIALLAYLKRADISITMTDWLFLGSAMMSLPLWYLTSDPLWAVVILTVVDVLGFGPTVRKAYAFPHTESVSFFILFIIRNLVVIAALDNYSVTTLFFPAVVVVACIGLVTMLLVRRRALPA